MNDSTRSSLILVTALMSEARPLIDFFRLKKECDAPFTIFSNSDSDIKIIISGMGAIAVAAAVGFMAERDGCHSKAWLNVGIAGHRFMDIGSSVRVLSHRFEHSQRKQYVSQTVPWAGHVAELITLSEASSSYPDNDLIDMEGAGYFSSALHFSGSELVQAIKVVSDNQSYSADNLTSEVISDLILENRPAILGFIEQLQSFLDEPVVSDDWESRVTWPLSHSQRQIVTDHLQASNAFGLQNEALLIVKTASDFDALNAGLINLLTNYCPQLTVPSNGG